MTGHHIATDKTLLGVGGALLVLTVLTVGVHYLHLPDPWSIIVAMGIAIFKATLVALFFMHLYWDEKFNTMILITAFVFFTLLVSFSLLDFVSQPEIHPGF